MMTFAKIRQSREKSSSWRRNDESLVKDAHSKRRLMNSVLLVKAFGKDDAT